MTEGFNQLSEKFGQLKLESEDGKKYLTDVADAETLMREIYKAHIIRTKVPLGTV